MVVHHDCSVSLRRATLLNHEPSQGPRSARIKCQAPGCPLGTRVKVQTAGWNDIRADGYVASFE